jgi:hypothetical protein
VAARIFYLTPDHAAPSWGVGLLYEHVRLLREAGFAAWVLHHRSGFRVPWLETDVPVVSLDQPGWAPTPEDLLVVPEVLAGEPTARRWPGRRGVFVQGSFLALNGQQAAFRYPQLGYDFGFAVLPHVAAVVERHFGLRCRVVPPFVAEYFFVAEEAIRQLPRQPLVLLTSKDDYRRVGFPDANIFRQLMARHCVESAPGWRVEELTGLSHRQTSARLAEASFLVNLNSHEAFNTTVPEAMAAGCAVLCYEAVGGRDFLTDGGNALVFPNHHVYALVERLQEVMADGVAAPGLLALRLRARAEVTRFTVEATRRALSEAFAALLAPVVPAP